MHSIDVHGRDEEIEQKDGTFRDHRERPPSRNGVVRVQCRVPVRASPRNQRQQQVDQTGDRLQDLESEAQVRAAHGEALVAHEKRVKGEGDENEEIEQGPENPNSSCVFPSLYNERVKQVQGTSDKCQNPAEPNQSDEARDARRQLIDIVMNHPDQRGVIELVPIDSALRVRQTRLIDAKRPSEFRRRVLGQPLGGH